MTPKEFLSLWIVNSYLKSYIFCLYFILYLLVHVYVDADPDPYLFWNTDPDPQSSWIRIQYGSISTSLTESIDDVQTLSLKAIMQGHFSSLKNKLWTINQLIIL